MATIWAMNGGKSPRPNDPENLPAESTGGKNDHLPQSSGILMAEGSQGPESEKPPGSDPAVLQAKA